jgi:hypothetical protein
MLGTLLDIPGLIGLALAQAATTVFLVGNSFSFLYCSMQINDKNCSTSSEVHPVRKIQK